MGRPPSPDRDKFIVRLPDGMRDQIKAAAEENDRTMNAEVVARLAASFESGKRAPVTATIRATGAPGSEYVDERIKELSDVLGEKLEELERKVARLDERLKAKTR